MKRTIEQVDAELQQARADLRGNLPTHERVDRCERLWDERANLLSLTAAKR